MLCSRRILCVICFTAVAAAAALPVQAQTVWHLQDRGDSPPGVIGMRQLERGGPRPGYFQPVEITADNGALISLVTEHGFTDPKREKTLAAMLIGPVYRLKVSNIQHHEGDEVY